MKRIVFGLLGSRLDWPSENDRWQRWRPSVAICQHEDFLVDRFELLYEPKLHRIATITAQDIATVSPETIIRLHELEFCDAWDFEEV
ncbi:MAG: hypothetical protein KDB23_16300, partial [Planctomycetales bacterium]|nr:hypothetical protein [Planctomycetales bacterium]